MHPPVATGLTGVTKALRKGGLAPWLREMTRGMPPVTKQFTRVVVVPTQGARPITRLPCHRWTPCELALLPVPIVVVATLRVEPVTFVPDLLQFPPDATMRAE